MEGNATKKKRAEWTEEQMEKAVRAVNNGSSVNKASKDYRIPRRTLRNHLKSGKTSRKLGRNSVLTTEQEQELCSRIFRLADVGMPITGKLIRRSVFSYCEENNITHSFNANTQKAGRKWLRLFLGRHPEVARRRTQNLNPARACKLNKFIVTDYFDKLKTVINETDVAGKPQLIYNIDEKGCRLTLHHQQQVLAKKGAKRVHIVAPEHAENVTIVTCGNASGQFIPPVILFKGQRLKPEWTENLPPGTNVIMTPKGSMTTDVFIKWLEHFSQFRVGNEKVLLIFDGVSSHLDANIVKAADKYKITLFCLPSNTTHELQPLDKAVFKSFEAFWDDAVLRFWMNNPERSIRRTVFGRIFSEVWSKAMTAGNIISGFRATGIYPFNPTVIPESAFAPSCLTELDDPNHELTEENLKTSSFQHKTTEDNKTGNTLPKKITTAPPTRKTRKLTAKQTSVEDDSTSDSADSSMYSVHDSSEDENLASFLPSVLVEEDDSALNLNISFTELLSTPNIKSRRVQRKKSINSRAQKLVVDLFNTDAEKTNANKTTSKPRNKKGHKVTNETNEPLPSTSAGPQPKKQKVKESWYCFVCNKDEVKDMRMCNLCGKYVHEECVGLTKGDKDVFVCPQCVT